MSISFVYRIRSALAASHVDLGPIHVETWDDLMNVGKQKSAKYVQNYRIRNSLRNYSRRRSFAAVCVPACPHDKTKTAEIKIVKLGIQIVHHDTSPTNGHRSKLVLGLGLGDRTYAPLSSAYLVLSVILFVGTIKSKRLKLKLPNLAQLGIGHHDTSPTN